jgi:dTDP-4-dehydrorhamnose reductase
MINIGLLGANGQVGAEVAIRLAKKEGVRVTGFSRSSYGGTILRRAEVPCETYDLADTARLKDRFGSFDLVADFTYPSGSPTTAVDAVRTTTASVMAALRPGARFVHMSSVAAFGMDRTELRIRSRRIPRSSYASIKRAGETVARKLGRRHTIPTYIFRLGQVHGTLQSVTKALKDELTWNDVVVDAGPDELTATVFTSTIATALYACALGTAPPGSYAMVESPPWTLKTLFAYYSSRYDLAPVIHYRPVAPRGGTSIKNWLTRRIGSVRGMLEANVLIKSERLYRYTKGWYMRAGGLDRFSDSEMTTRVDSSARQLLLGRVPWPEFQWATTTPDRIRSEDVSFDSALKPALIGLGDTSTG